MVVKVLCLHGSRQTGEIFEHQLNKMCRALSRVAEFYFFDAPCILSSCEVGDAVATYSWCGKNFEEEGTGSEEDPYFLADTVVQDRMTSGSFPYDVILGFSQGALVAARYVMLQRLHGEGAYGPPLKGLILAASPNPCSTFPSLSAAYQKCLQEEVGTTGFLDALPSLHIVGRKDTIVDPAESLSFSEACQPNAELFLHDHAHSIPELQSLFGVVKSFLERVAALNRDKAERNAEEMKAEGEGTMSPECQEELEMLSCMYGEECLQRGVVTVVSLPLLLDGRDDDALDAPLSTLRLRVTLPKGYPMELPKLEVVGGPNTRHLPYERWKADMIARTLTYLREDLGVGNAMLLPAMMFAGEVVTSDMTFLQSVFLEKHHSDTGNNDSLGRVQQDEAWWTADEAEDERRLYIAEADRFANGLLMGNPPNMQLRCDQLFDGENSDCVTRGGLQELTVGLIGKPSAGKSTFFNAVTDPESEGNAARVAAFPFTTIKPNIGTGFGPLFCPCCVLPLSSPPCDALYGHLSIAGVPLRRHPIAVKDVAGLVQGAYLGKGRGNQFLNDLCDATVLVHVVDGAGATDADGSPCSPGTGTTLDDIVWVRGEVHSWIYDNLRTRWESIRKKPIKLRTMFTGYRSPPSFADAILRLLGITNDAELMYRIPFWDALDLHKLVALYVRMRFPIVIALNKSDIRPVAEKMLLELQRRYPHETFVSMSAKMECNLLHLRQKGLVRYLSGELSFEEVVCNSAVAPEESKALVELRQFFTSASSSCHTGAATRCITTGVQDVLAAAISRCSGLLLYPVTSMKLPISSLKECFVFRPNTNVGVVFSSLVNVNLLDGKLVRFEAALVEELRAGREAVPLKKDAKLPGRHVMVRILTNKRQMIL